MGVLLNRRRCTKELKILTKEDFTWSYGNIENNGRISSYKNVLSDIFYIGDKWNYIKVKKDSRYNTIVSIYNGTSFIQKNIVTTYDSKIPLPREVTAIRILLWDQPTLDYVQNESTFKITLY